MADFSDEEFRDELYKFSFEMLDSSKTLIEDTEFLGKIPFQELTPEHWAVVVQVLAAAQSMARYQYDSIIASSNLLGDKELLDRLKVYALKEDGQ